MRVRERPYRWVVRSSSNLCNALQGWPPLAPTTIMPAHTSRAAAARAAPVASLTVNLLLHLKKRDNHRHGLRHARYETVTIHSNSNNQKS